METMISLKKTKKSTATTDSTSFRPHLLYIAIGSRALKAIFSPTPLPSLHAATNKIPPNDFFRATTYLLIENQVT
jgi:hypothetical protein